MGRSLLFVFGAVLLVGCVAASKIVTLTEENFDQQVQPDQVWVVKFYAPWCGHCTAMAAAFEELAEAVDGSSVHAGQVDATEDRILADRFGVNGFPTIRVFVAGTMYDYEGDRSAEDMKNFAEGEFLHARYAAVPGPGEKAPPMMPSQALQQFNKASQEWDHEGHPVVAGFPFPESSHPEVDCDIPEVHHVSGDNLPVFIDKLGHDLRVVIPALRGTRVEVEGPQGRTYTVKVSPNKGDRYILQSLKNSTFTFTVPEPFHPSPADVLTATAEVQPNAYVLWIHASIPTNGVPRGVHERP